MIRRFRGRGIGCQSQILTGLWNQTACCLYRRSKLLDSKWFMESNSLLFVSEASFWIPKWFMESNSLLFVSQKQASGFQSGLWSQTACCLYQKQASGFQSGLWSQTACCLYQKQASGFQSGLWSQTACCLYQKQASRLHNRELRLIPFQLIFDVFRPAGMTAPDPGFERFHLDDDAENGDALHAMLANGGGIPGVVSQ